MNNKTASWKRRLKAVSTRARKQADEIEVFTSVALQILSERDNHCTRIAELEAEVAQWKGLFDEALDAAYDHPDCLWSMFEDEQLCKGRPLLAAYMKTLSQEKKHD